MLISYAFIAPLANNVLDVNHTPLSNYRAESFLKLLHLNGGNSQQPADDSSLTLVGVFSNSIRGGSDV